MSEITVEKRLELIHNIRRENERNCMNLKNREQILSDGWTKDAENEEKGAHSYVFLRVLAAVILFSLFIAADQSENGTLRTVSAEIYTRITENYDWNGIDFIHKITYTLRGV